MGTCGICCHARSMFVMNNKFVCLRCDDLLFDIELEMDEEEKVSKESGNELVLKAASKRPTSSSA